MIRLGKTVLKNTKIIFSAIAHLILVSSLFLCLSMSKSLAQEAKSAAKENIDAVLLLDASASMRVTDPKRMRDEGAKLLLQFLKSGDRLGVIEFDSEARILRPLTEYHPVQDREIEAVIRSASDSGLYTDLVRGVLKAKKLLEEGERKDSSRIIILLSDGKLEPDPELSSVEGLRAGLVYGLLPELKQKGIVLHTLALSPEADRDLLEQMAQATDGSSWYSEKAEQIHEAFAQLFLVVNKPQIVPMTTKGFRIDGEVEQATFYVNTEGREDKEVVSLHSPSGNVYNQDTLGPGMRWFTGQKFDTVTIDDPEAGDWRIIGLSANKGFATILTNLKLITDWPTSLIAGNKRMLRARLYEDDKPIVLPAMTRETTYAFQILPIDRVSEPLVRSILNDEGKDGDDKPDDGIFSQSVLIEEPGDYQLKVLAKGPTFERQQTISFRVKPRLVNLSLVAVENAETLQLGSPAGTTLDYFRVTLNPKVASLKNIVVKLIAKDKSGKLYNLDLKKRTDGSLRYEVPAASLVFEGEYELQATIVGETRTKKVKGTSQVLPYKKVKAKVHEKQVISHIVVDEPVVEEPPALLFSILILLANIGTAAFCFVRLKSNAGSSVEEAPDPKISDEILAALESVKEQAAQTEVNLDDPRFSQDADIILPPSSNANSGNDVVEDDENSKQEGDSYDQDSSEEEIEDEER